MAKNNKHYNLFEGEKLVLEDVDAKTIKEFTKRPTLKFSDYDGTGIKINGVYTLVRSDNCPTEVYGLPSFAEKWESVCKPFRNVIWVQSGGRKISLWGE